MIDQKFYDPYCSGTAMFLLKRGWVGGKSKAHRTALYGRITKLVITLPFAVFNLMLLIFTLLVMGGMLGTIVN